MVTINDVSFEFAGRFLYRNANWDIQPGDKVGLIGRNGTGKSTLLRLIAGEYQATEGTVTRASSMKIGFLNQDLLGFESSSTIFEVARAGFSDLLAVQDKIDALLKRLETEVTDQILNELGELQEAFERKGGYEIDARTGAMLGGLGFSTEDQHQPYDTFSGGWRMRAILARILLQGPDLLLLDEPTNHLDLPSIQWLEDYLRRAGAAYVIVSHDREFLNRMVDKIVEVSHSKLNHYSGNYAFYLTEREQRRVIQQASYENQQKYIADAERFIERFKAKASKATQAQSRVKMLEKLDRIEEPESDEAVVSFRFQPSVKPGNEILTVKDISKSFGPKHILDGAEATIMRGDKIGLIGANGLGKSTVLRILADHDTFTGERKLGYNVAPSFYAQHQLEALSPQKTILDECKDFAYEKGETYVRSILGGFLFTGDDVYKPVKVLSGGERSRVALAKTLLSEANFLLLDEPTNHLDMQSIQILAQALSDYEGTYIVVSHDRHFLSLATNKIWYLEDRKIKEYPGSYTEFEAWQKEKAAQQKEKDKEKSSQTPPKLAQSPHALKTAPAAKAQLTDEQRRKLKTLQTQLRKAEQEVSEWETKMAHLESELQNPSHQADFYKLAEIDREKGKAEEALLKAMAAWEELSEQVRALEKA